MPKCPLCPNERERLIKLRMLMTYRSLLSIDVNISTTALIRIYMYNDRAHFSSRRSELWLWKITNDNRAVPGHQSGCGGWVRSGCQLYIPKANTSIALVNLQYMLMLFSSAGPLLHTKWDDRFHDGLGRNRRSFLLWWGRVIYPWMPSNKAEFITSSQSPLKKSHLYCWILYSSP